MATSSSIRAGQNLSFLSIFNYTIRSYEDVLVHFNALNGPTHPSETAFTHFMSFLLLPLLFFSRSEDSQNTFKHSTRCPRLIIRSRGVLRVRHELLVPMRQQLNKGRLLLLDFVLR